MFNYPKNNYEKDFYLFGLYGNYRLLRPNGKTC